MAVQQTLCFETPTRSAASPPGIERRRGGEVVLVTGGHASEAGVRLLERALADAGLAEHDPLELGHIAARNRPWAGRSRLVVAFGADAASAFLGRAVSLNLERGKVRPLPDGGRVLVTEHPRVILGLSDPVARGREYRRLVNDLLLAVPYRRLAA
jgi:hypothetical protein